MKSMLDKIVKNITVVLMALTALGEIITGSWISGIGWGAAAFWLFAYETEQTYFNELLELARKNVHSGEIERKSAIIDPGNADIDHILAIGRDLQNADRWHGAQYDTVKLLCDTIERLRDNQKDEEV
jgi:hypothetical protein